MTEVNIARERWKAIFVERFMAHVRSSLLEAVMSCGKTLDQIAADLDITEDVLFDRLMSGDGVTVRWIAELCFATTGQAPELIFEVLSPEAREIMAGYPGEDVADGRDE